MYIMYLYILYQCTCLGLSTEHIYIQTVVTVVYTCTLFNITTERTTVDTLPSSAIRPIIHYTGNTHSLYMHVTCYIREVLESPIFIWFINHLLYICTYILIILCIHDDMIMQSYLCFFIA